MSEMLQTMAVSFWQALEEMSPYLLFGFLAAGLLSILISPPWIERHLGGAGFLQLLKASLFGVPLPLCSCGVIPVAASLRRHGASRGATTSFLLSTPQTGVDSILVTFSMLGPFVAIFRPIAAFVMGIIGGTLVNWFGDSKEVENVPPACQGACCVPSGKRGKLAEAIRYGFVTLPEDISKSLLVGLVVAALITAVVPESFFANYVGAGFVGMLVMMVFGIPLYVCATASVPIAWALIFHAGVSPGAALVFLITGPATNAATIATLWKIMGRRTVFIYLATVAVSALASGLALDGMIEFVGAGVHEHGAGFLPGWVGTLSAVALIVVLASAIYRARQAGMPKERDTDGFVELLVDGMTCGHCASKVEDLLSAQPGVESVEVDLAGGKAFIKGADIDVEAIKESAKGLGYGVTEGGEPQGD